MIKKYCFDTSALSNPVLMMPPDIHVSLWATVIRLINAGIIAATPEIYLEMKRIFAAPLAACIVGSETSLVLEHGQPNWDWRSCIGHFARMQMEQKDYLSENQGGTKKTISENDLSTVALAKTLDLPLVSMEIKVSAEARMKRRIPDVCELENVEHLCFNDFLRREKLTF